MQCSDVYNYYNNKTITVSITVIVCSSILSSLCSSIHPGSVCSSRSQMRQAMISGTTLVVDRYAFSGVAFTAAKEVGFLTQTQTYLQLY